MRFPNGICASGSYRTPETARVVLACPILASSMYVYTYRHLYFYYPSPSGGNHIYSGFLSSSDMNDWIPRDTYWSETWGGVYVKTRTTKCRFLKICTPNLEFLSDHLRNNLSKYNSIYFDIGKSNICQKVLEDLFDFPCNLQLIVPTKKRFSQSK